MDFKKIFIYLYHNNSNNKYLEIMKNYRITAKQKEVFRRIVKVMHTGRTITRSTKYSGGKSTSYFSFNGHEEKAVSALVQNKYLVYQHDCSILMLNNDLLMTDDIYFDLVSEIRVEVKAIAKAKAEKDAKEMQVVKEIVADYNIKERYLKYSDLMTTHYNVWSRREDIAKGKKAKDEAKRLKDIRLYQILELSKSLYIID